MKPLKVELGRDAHNLFSGTNSSSLLLLWWGCSIKANSSSWDLDPISFDFLKTSFLIKRPLSLNHQFLHFWFFFCFLPASNKPCIITAFFFNSLNSIYYLMIFSHMFRFLIVFIFCPPQLEWKPRKCRSTVYLVHTFSPELIIVVGT